MTHVKIGLLITCLLTLFLFGKNALAQLPRFFIVRSDMSYFGNKDLKKEIPVLFMYFSPTCHECEEMTSAILSRIEELKNIQIVMISCESITALSEFEIKNKISQYDNLIAGTEGNTLLFFQIFQIEKLPFLIFYDKEGKFILKYDNNKTAKSFIEELINCY